MPPKKNAGRGRGRGRGRSAAAAESSRSRSRARGPSPDREAGSGSAYETSPEAESEAPAPATPRRALDPPASGSGASAASNSAPNSNRRQQGSGGRAARAWNYTDVPLNPDQRARNERVAGRMLISWNRPRMAEKLLLNMQYELVQAGIEIPYDRIAHRLRPGASGSAVQQFLGRTRERLVAEGHLVPPVPGSVFRREVRGYVRRDPESDDLRSTRPVEFSERFEDRLVSLPDAANLHANRRRGGRRAAQASDEEKEEDDEDDEDEESPVRNQAPARKRQRPSHGSPGSADRRRHRNANRYTGIRQESPSGDVEESVEDDRESDLFLRNDTPRFQRANPRRARRNREAHRPDPRARDPEYWQPQTPRGTRGYPPAAEEQDEQDEEEAAFNWRQPPPPLAYPEEARLRPTRRDTQQMAPDYRTPPMRAPPPPPAAPDHDGYPPQPPRRIPFNPLYGAPPAAYNSPPGHGYWPPMPPPPAAASPHGPNYPQHPYPPPPWEEHGYDNRDPDYQTRGHGQPIPNPYSNPAYNMYGNPPPQGNRNRANNNNSENIYGHPAAPPPATAFHHPPAPPAYPTEGRRRNARSAAAGGNVHSSGGGSRQQQQQQRPAVPYPPPSRNPQLPLFADDDESTQAQGSPGSERRAVGQGSDAGGGGDGGEGGGAGGEVKYKREDSK